MTYLLAFFVLLFVGGAAPAQNNSPEGWVQGKFAPGGSIRFHLSSGGYTISGTDSSAIVITYRYKNSARLKQVKAWIKAGDSGADVWVQNTPHDNFEATIEVPHRSNLWVRLSAGEVKIEGIEGDKDVESHAGEIDIEIPHPDEYGHRDASVLAGSLEASAFDVSKGGLWRSFEQTGPGKYHLHAHVTAGEINFRGTQ
jgi:hypothetical protein